MKPKFKLLFLMLFIFCNCIAQNKFKYQTFSDSVVKDGFYQINLLPSIVAKCKPTLDDIRLFDANDNQIPYLIKDGEQIFEQNEFIPFHKLSTNNKEDSIIMISTENYHGKAIDNLVLILKNSLAERSINISGGDDLMHWYVVKENIDVEITRDVDETHAMQSIALPPINYKYLKITFNGKQADPIYIETIGTYKKGKLLKDYFTIPKPIISQKDSGKISFVTLIYDAHYKIDKFQLFASGAPFFERNIYFDERYNDTHKTSEYIVISSKSNNIFFLHLPLKKENTVKFMVENNDNQPLHIDSAQTYQKAENLFAYLKAGQKYRLTFGNDSLAAPVYDISAFSDSLKNARLLLTGEITANHFTKKEPSTAKSFNNKIWLWTAIICVLLLLLYFTSSMLKQVNKKQQSDF